jgi:hypothetical protein
MPSKRVSLKGKGADLFFGEYTPDGGTPPLDPEPPASDVLDPNRSPDAETTPVVVNGDLEVDPIAPRGGVPVVDDGRRPAARQRRRTNERTVEPSNERSNVVSNERSNDRTRVRHSFDVFEDQLRSLAEIQIRRYDATRRKPKLGELVQEALDAYIERNERTNERTNGRRSG